MTTTIVSSGQVQGPTTLLAGDMEFVLSGGTVNSTTITSGAEQVLSAGALANTITVFGGGTEVVYGTVNLAAIQGGTMTVSSGGVGSNTLVAGGGTVVVDGGSLVNAAVQSLGQINVSGGSTNSSVLQGRETLVGSGGTAAANHTAILNGGVLYVGLSGTASATVVNSGGEEFVDRGGQSVQTFIATGGIEVVEGATATTGSGAMFGTESGAEVNSGGILEVIGAASLLDPTTTIPNVNLLPGATIDLRPLAFNSADTANIDTTTDLLTISGPTSTTIQLTGSYNTEYFHLSSDGNGGTDITVDGTPCYCRGTHILTEDGEVAVENLAIGDRLVLASGGTRVLRWIGTRSYAGRFTAGNADVLPVTIRAGALADGVPKWDLRVSPLHAMFLDGVLIPALALVNGDTITQAESVDQVEYFHLELDSHDIIIAEGALSESFVDDDSRGMFHNAAEYAVLYPDALRGPAVYCAPRVEDGPVLESVRRRLVTRLRSAANARYRGNLDLVRRDRIVGWAVNDADPGRRVTVRLCDRGVAIGQTIADQPRQDLLQAGIGDGAYGFALTIAGGLSPLTRHVITAETLDGTRLEGEVILEAAILETDSAQAPRLSGHVDLVSRDRVLGWVADPSDPTVTVAVQVLVDGVLVASILANRMRRDLAEARDGDGRHAFDYRFTPALSPLLRHVVELRCEADGTIIGEPMTLQPANGFDSDMEEAVAQAVTGLKPDKRDHVLNFMLAQADRLRQQQADELADRTDRELDREARWAGQATSGLLLRALVIDAAMPDPRRDAGSQAVLSHMRALQRLGYEVSFVAAEQLTASGAGLAAENITACSAPLYSSVEDVLRRQAGCFDLVYLHRADIAETYLALARRWMARARIVYSVADLHHVRVARQAEVEQRPELVARSRRLRLAECTAAWNADAVLTHSPQEAALLRAAVPQAEVHVVPWDVPIQATRTPFAKRSGVAFIGNYAHAPNVDAARFLVEEVMPLVWSQDPSIKCHLAGSSMPPVVRALAGPMVQLKGRVPDLEPLFNSVRLTVAPLRFGAGIKGKVLDSMAAGVPCAMSPIAAEALDLPATLARLVGDGAAALADVILTLHSNATVHSAAARAGRALVLRGNSLERVTQALALAVKAPIAVAVA